MSASSTPWPLVAGPTTGPKQSCPIERCVRADQVAAIKKSMPPAIVINVLLGLASLAVAVHGDVATAGMVWFAALAAVNLARFLIWRSAPAAPNLASIEQTDRHLRWTRIGAFACGLVWAFLPTLCEGYTAPTTVFFLIVLCGVTAGAIMYNSAYSTIPIALAVPSLLSAAFFIFMVGGFEHRCLAATILLYLGAIIRAARMGEATFRTSSILKNEATELAASLREAHDRASEVAAEMSYRAAHDPLTGLLNRAGFMTEVDHRIAEAPSRHRLVLLDLDGFKSINDVYGHKTGDRVLVEVARRLKALLPREYAIARLGGDEFAIFHRLDGKRDARGMATELIAAVKAPFETLDAGRLGACAGLHEDDGVSVAGMLICADEALHAAKRAGRNQHRLFDQTLRTRVTMRRDIEGDLVRALSDRALEVWYQPIFGEGGRQLSSLEALIRWHHPKHGWISPPDLIAAATTAGHAEDLLRFIVEEVCDMIETLQANGSQEIGVAMNISPREMSQLPVDEIVLTALRLRRLQTHSLEIEITEETAMDIRAVRDKLFNLSDAGVRITIDDFGVGYSSLSSLRQVRADRVKIDRCFVTGISGSADDQALVDAVLSLGRALKLDVIAEGVETEDDLTTLQAAGCNYMQGYHLGRPAPAADVVETLTGRRSVAA